MKVNLFTTYYNDLDRNVELMTVQALNHRNKVIDKVYIWDETEQPCNVTKFEIKRRVRRPTFQDLFDWVNEVTGDNDINIIANSDIYFDDMGLEMMKVALGVNDCWALTRWDVNSNNMVRQGDVMVHDCTFMNRRDSQDSWCFKGRIHFGNFDFELGKPGCDNAIAHRLQEAGYNVTNPSWTIKTFHLHKGDARPWHGTARVEPPYTLLNPTEL